MTSSTRLWLALLVIPSVGRVNAAPEPKADPLTLTNCSVVSDCSPMGVAIRMGMVREDGLPDHEFQLLYQLRIHTKKGDLGPLLRPKEAAQAPVHPLGNGKKGALPAAEFDVTRGELSGMTNWLASEEGELEGGSTRTVFLRVEPHVFDVTDQVYLTPAKSNAVILVAEVDAASKVKSFQSLSAWLLQLHNNDAIQQRPAMLQYGLGKLNELDAYDTQGNQLPHMFYTLLREEKMDEADRLQCIQAVPKDVFQDNRQTKAGGAVVQFLDAFTKEGSPPVKAAARKKLDEIYPRKPNNDDK